MQNRVRVMSRDAALAGGAVEGCCLAGAPTLEYRFACRADRVWLCYLKGLSLVCVSATKAWMLHM
jgi:hypothetical protein